MNGLRNAALLLLLGLGLQGAAIAHPSVSGQIIIGDGPLSLGLGLNHLNRHYRHHEHGPACYRRYPRSHQHWYRESERWHDDDYRHDRHHGHHRKPPRHARAHGHDRRPHWARHHNSNRHEGHHQHSRDCHLHYPRDHQHWR